jgi:predicted 3-demethylubiquinone-9 3-methyltransferase (glyoxalase superfamily)
MGKHYIQAYAFTHAGTIENEANNRTEADKIFNKLLDTANQQLNCGPDECARVTIWTKKKQSTRKEFAKGR